MTEDMKLYAALSALTFVLKCAGFSGGINSFTQEYIRFLLLLLERHLALI